MAAKPGDIAWAGEHRLIWLVLAKDKGMVVRSGNRHHWPRDKDREIGVVDRIHAGGLEPIDDDTVTLTDDELALIAKGVLLNDIG